MTSSGPFQPQTFCDFVIAGIMQRYGETSSSTQNPKPSLEVKESPKNEANGEVQHICLRAPIHILSRCNPGLKYTIHGMMQQCSPHQPLPRGVGGAEALVVVCLVEDVHFFFQGFKTPHHHLQAQILIKSLRVCLLPSCLLTHSIFSPLSSFRNTQAAPKEGVEVIR